MSKRNDLDVANFWNKVAITADDKKCWEWTRGCDSYNYGHLRWGSRLELAHRIAWTLTYGSPKELHVLHTCDNTKCCNPKHLFLGTHQDNMEDRLRKGKYERGLQHPKHKLTPELVLQARQRRSNGESCKVIASDFGLHPSTIDFAVRRVTWKEVE